MLPTVDYGRRACCKTLKVLLKIFAEPIVMDHGIDGISSPNNPRCYCFRRDEGNLLTKFPQGVITAKCLLQGVFCGIHHF
jgi:hypothetical protein